MRSLMSISDEYSSLLNGLDEWVDETYEREFSKYFVDQRTMSARLQKTSVPVSNEDLSFILIDTPLKLFEVAEVVNKVRLKMEAIKLHIKEKETYTERNSKESSESKRKSEAAQSVLEDKLLLSAYESVVTRVEKEMSYSRELIMSAKKIWDSRMNANNSMPVSENIEPNVEDLPDYKGPCDGKTYIS